MKTFLQPLTAGEEREYLKRYKEGDEEARAVLINRNMRLVAHVIKKYQSSDYEMEDLLSVGTIGLIKAVNTFNMEKGSRLATYAAKCVENAIRSPGRLWILKKIFRAEKKQNSESQLSQNIGYDYGIEKCNMSQKSILKKNGYLDF